MDTVKVWVLKRYSRVVNTGYNRLLPFMSTFLLSAIFLTTGSEWLIFIAFLPLFLYIKTAKDLEQSKTKAILLIWLSGFLFFLLSQIWMVFIDTNSWGAVNGSAALTGLIFCWVYVSLGFSLAYLFFAWAVFKYKISFLSPMWLIVLPALWTLSEYLRSYVYALFTWGSEATFGAHWNFSNVGFAAIATPLGFASRFVGLFGLCFVVIVVNVALFRLLFNKDRFNFVALGLCVAVSAIGFYSFKANGSPTRVGVVSLKKYSSNYGKTLEKAVPNQKNSAAAEIIVLPEESLFYTLPPTERVQIKQKIFKNNTGYIITSGFETNPDGSPSPVIQYFDTNDRLLSAQKKNFLIPVGEFLPKALEVAMNITGNKASIEQHKKLRSYTKGTIPEEPVQLGNVRVGALACSGVLSPYLYRDITNKGSEILANSAALDIFAKNNIYYNQTKNVVRFQAIANARPFIHSAIGGQSFILSAAGNVLATTQPRQTSYKSAVVTTSSHKTIYSRLGEYFIYFSIIIVALCFIFARRRRPTS